MAIVIVKGVIPFALIAITVITSISPINKSKESVLKSFLKITDKVRRIYDPFSSVMVYLPVLTI
jgi:hypothetical protein